MRQIRTSKRHTPSADWQQEPRRPGPRDPSIVKAHRLTRHPLASHRPTAFPADTSVT